MIDPVTIGDATLINADVLDGLRSLAVDSVDCVVTSPPYWGLRDYGVEGMLGLEPTFAEYLAKMVAVMGEVRRVLKPTGTCWVNMGDAYANATNGGDKVFGNPEFNENRPSREATKTGKKTLSGFKAKDLLMMPARLAIALQEDGWWVRSEIIWAKPNPMPESVTDRPTSAHEKIYLLTKAAKYYYDADAVREAHIGKPIGGGFGHKADADEFRDGSEHSKHGREYNPAGRNLRNVWTIATQPFSDWGFSFDEADYADSDGIPYTASQDCPVHGRLWNRRKRQKESGGEQLGLAALRNLGKSCCHEQEQPVELSSIVLNCNSETIAGTSHEQNPENIAENKNEVSRQTCEDDPIVGGGIPDHTNHISESPRNPVDNSGSLFRDSVQTAIPRNKQKNKTDPALLTSPSCRVSAESPSRTEHKLAVSCSNYTCTCRKCQVSHFATFPEALPQKCIMAGCPEHGLVLDPFSGSGTTGLVALKLDRRYIGIELNPDYLALSIKRIEMEARQEKLFNGGTP